MVIPATGDLLTRRYVDAAPTCRPELPNSTEDHVVSYLRGWAD